MSPMAGGRRSDDSLATILLTQHLVDAGAKPLRASEYWSVATRLDGPGTLLGADGPALARRVGIGEPDRERIRSLLDQATTLAFELERLEQMGVVAVTAAD